MEAHDAQEEENGPLDDPPNQVENKRPVFGCQVVVRVPKALFIALLVKEGVFESALEVLDLLRALSHWSN